MMKWNIVIAMALLSLLVAPAAAHSLWVEAEDAVEVGAVKDVYSFFGHPGSSAGMYVPLMEAFYLVSPAGERFDLATEEGSWLPGFGRMGYLSGKAAFYWPGDYVLASVRAPGVYDTGWHGGESNPMLVMDYAKSIIAAGEGGEKTWDGGFPLEIEFDSAPYGVKSGDSFNAVATFNGEAVAANYTAWYWTVDAHSSSEALRGTAGEDGSFSVLFNKAGPWMIEVETTTEEPGEWTATYSNPYYKEGDLVSYEKVWHRSSLTLWVR
jgi:cobalt/nickel transport protein